MNRYRRIDSWNALDAPTGRDQTRRMDFSADHPLLLHRVDATRNMARFYALTLAPTLFGETALVRNWGRIGKRGQMCLNTFASAREAEHAMARLHARKARRGYRPPADATRE